jgi:hypothetical protein
LFSALSEYFGNVRTVIEFMRAFSGTTLQIPPAQVVESFSRDEQTARQLGKDPSVGVVRRLSQSQGVPTRDIAKQFKRGSGKRLSDYREETIYR